MDFGRYDYTTLTVDDVIKEIFTAMPLSAGGTVYICSFAVGSSYRAIIQPYSDRYYASAIVFGYSIGTIILYVKHAGTVTKYIINSNPGVVI